MIYEVCQDLTSKLSEEDDYIYLCPTVTGNPYETILCGKTHEEVGKLHYLGDKMIMETEDPRLRHYIEGIKAFIELVIPALYEQYIKDKIS